MSAIPLSRVHPVLQGSPYQSYVYAYPHKTAYRPLDPPRRLTDVWADEPRGGGYVEGSSELNAQKCVAQVAVAGGSPGCQCGLCQQFAPIRLREAP